MRHCALFFMLCSILAVVGCKREAAPPDGSNGSVEAAYDYLQTAHGVEDPARQFALLEQQEDSLGQTHLRFQQLHQGIPVYAANIVVHLNPDRSGRHLTGQIFPISAEIPTSPAVTTAEARNTAVTHECAETAGEPELVYYVIDINKPALAWRVPGQRGMLTCDVFVAADQPRVIASVNRSPSSRQEIEQ